MSVRVLVNIAEVSTIHTGCGSYLGAGDILKQEDVCVIKISAVKQLDHDHKY